jgi:hypothetical protein
MNFTHPSIFTDLISPPGNSHSTSTLPLSSVNVRGRTPLPLGNCNLKGDTSPMNISNPPSPHSTSNGSPRSGLAKSNGDRIDDGMTTSLPPPLSIPNLDKDAEKADNKKNPFSSPWQNWEDSRELIQKGDCNMVLYKIFYKHLQPPSLTTLVPLLGFEWRGSMDQERFVPAFRSWSIYSKIPPLFLASQCILRKFEMLRDSPGAPNSPKLYWEFYTIWEDEIICWDAKDAPEKILEANRDHTQALKEKRPFIKDGVTCQYDQVKFDARLESPWPTSGCLIFFRYTYDGSEETRLLLVSDKHSSQEILNMRNNPDSITDLHLFFISPTLFQPPPSEGLSSSDQPYCFRRQAPPKYVTEPIVKLIRDLFISITGSIVVDLYRLNEELAYGFGSIWKLWQSRRQPQQQQHYRSETTPDPASPPPPPTRGYPVNSNNLLFLQLGKWDSLVQEFLVKPQVRASVHFKFDPLPFQSTVVHE